MANTVVHLQLLGISLSIFDIVYTVIAFSFGQLRNESDLDCSIDLDCVIVAAMICKWYRPFDQSALGIKLGVKLTVIGFEACLIFNHSWSSLVK